MLRAPLLGMLGPPSAGGVGAPPHRPPRSGRRAGARSAPRMLARPGVRPPLLAAVNAAGVAAPVQRTGRAPCRLPGGPGRLSTGPTATTWQ
eukprot:8984630-Alexandrium_andersonii.AAC.1